MHSLDIFLERRRTTQYDVEGTALELWHEGICPVCLALYAANQMRSLVNFDSTYAVTIENIQNRKGSFTHGNNF
jgi:hypothetical protein